MMRRSEVVELDMSVDDALKYIISMGVVAPPARRPEPRPRCPTPERKLPNLQLSTLPNPESPGASAPNLRNPICELTTAAKSPPPTSTRSSPFDGLGASPRPRRRHLHRPARSRGPGAGGVRPDRAEMFKTAESVRNEFVLKLSGKVRRRPPAPKRQPRLRARSRCSATHRGAQRRRHAALPARRREPVRRRCA